MAEITKIEFWNDVGFIDGAVEIPNLSAADPINPDITLSPTDPIVPSKDRFFSEIKIKAHYSELLTVSYMRLTIDLKNSLDVDVPHTFYGWVDSVELVSDGSLPNTVIRWHIDEWRTWKSAVTFGSGHVKRRPFRDLASTPIQNYQVRYLKLSDYLENILTVKKGEDTYYPGEQDIWWVIASINKSSQIRTFFYPVFMNLDNHPTATIPSFQFTDLNNNNATTTGNGITISSIYFGNFDEFINSALGVTVDAVNGVWLSPICPYQDESTITGVGKTADPLVFTTQPTGYSSVRGSILTLGTEQKKISRTKTLLTPLTSDENNRYVLTALDGTKLLDLPYGYTVTSVTTTLVIEPDGPYFEISFNNGSYGNLEGLTVNVPLLSFPVNSNAYNSYVYSGQRDYDREMRTVRSNSNAWKSSAGGAGSGAMMGAFGPAGLAIGAAGGATGGMVGYGVEMLYENDKEQQLTDRLQASQPSTMILSGNTLISYLRMYLFAIRKIEPDSYSAMQITNTRALFGISVDELMSSCDTLIRSTSPTGYYNIQNLIISGDIPVSAKRWIREKFRAGVRLI